MGSYQKISANKFVRRYSNPEKAIFKWTFELPSPDLFIWTNIKNTKRLERILFIGKNNNWT